MPLTLYANGSGGLLERLAATGADVIGVDWTTDMADARARIPANVSVQGNVDPAILFASKVRGRGKGGGSGREAADARQGVGWGRGCGAVACGAAASRSSGAQLAWSQGLQGRVRERLVVQMEEWGRMGGLDTVEPACTQFWGMGLCHAVLGLCDRGPRACWAHVGSTTAISCSKGWAPIQVHQHGRVQGAPARQVTELRWVAVAFQRVVDASNAEGLPARTQEHANLITPTTTL